MSSLTVVGAKLTVLIRLSGAASVPQEGLKDSVGPQCRTLFQDEMSGRQQVTGGLVTGWAARVARKVAFLYLR